MIPHIFKVIKDRRKICPECLSYFFKGELSIEFVYSVYNRNINYRWIHFDCWLKKHIKVVK
jgi:hypothetical protein